MDIGILGEFAIGALIGSDVVGVVSQLSAVSAQKQQVRLQAAQSNLAFSQKSLDNIEATKRAMETQAVQASGSGESLASPTVKALTLDTFQTGKKNMTNLDTEQRVAQLSAKSKLDALSDEQVAIPFEAVGKVAQQGAALGEEFNWF